MIRLVLAWLLASMSALLLLIGALMKKAAEVAVEKEYNNWAPKLARGLVEVAGFVCRARRDRWRRDLCFVQKVERDNGLTEAVSCFMNCWFLALFELARKARSLRFTQRIKSVLSVTALGIMATVLAARFPSLRPLLLASFVFLLFWLASGAVLRLVVLIYPKNHPRRQELLAELEAMGVLTRPIWVAQQFETAMFEGVPARIARRRRK